MRRFFFLALVSLLLFALVFVGVLAWGYARYTRPGPAPMETTVVIPRGSGVEAIADTLARAGVVSDALIFRLGVRVSRVDKGLQAGEYVFPRAVSAKGAAEVLLSGKTVVRRLTVAEGLTVRQVLDQLDATSGLRDTPDAPPEGSLLPETYHFSYGDSRADILLRMGRDMDQALRAAWRERAPGLPLKTPEEALILASIVEKETGLKAERARVAGVFINRLRRGMRLQSDPTVVYGLTGGGGALGRPLTRADLKKPTPYNTYTNDGLPPGPICNPGLAAIRAVLHPMATRELYFVADGGGGHAFAETLAEHNRNAAKWRKIRDGGKPKAFSQ